LEEKPPQLGENKNVYVQVTVLDEDEQDRKPQNIKNSLVEFFRESPLYNLDIDLERDQDYGREVEL
jgi:hypothetical protein